jgi:hypothetical protein
MGMISLPTGSLLHLFHFLSQIDYYFTGICVYVVWPPKAFARNGASSILSLPRNFRTTGLRDRDTRLSMLYLPSLILFLVATLVRALLDREAEKEVAAGQVGEREQTEVRVEVGMRVKREGAKHMKSG